MGNYPVSERASFSFGEGASAIGTGFPQDEQSTTKYHFPGSVNFGMAGPRRPSLARRLLIHGMATNSNTNHSSIVTEKKVARTLIEIPTRGQRFSQILSLTTYLLIGFPPPFDRHEFTWRHGHPL
jgi:hypothetical protein